MRAQRTTAKAGLGFTLIELMVAVTVLVILAMVAAPAMGDFILRSRLRAAADDLSSQIGIARAEAMRLGRNVSVQAVATSTTVWCAGGRQFNLAVGDIEGIKRVGDTAPPCDCSDATDALTCLVAGKTSLVNATDYTGVEMTAGGGSLLLFNRNTGMLDDLTSRTLTVRSKQKPDRYELNVVVTPMGHARVCVPSGFVNFGGYKTC